MKSKIAFSLLALSAQPAPAQIVNIQNILKGESKPGWSLALENSFERKSGNSDLERFSSQGSASWRKESHLWLATLRREYGEQSDTQYLDNTFYHLRYRYALNEDWSWEFFAQEDSDRFRFRQSRLVLGSGPHLRLIAEEDLNVALSVAPMYEREEFTGQLLGAKVNEKTRVSNMLSIAWKWQPHLSLSNVLYLQPKIDLWADRRVLNETSLHVALHEHVSLKTSHTLTYDARPPLGVERSDSHLRQSLVLNF